MITLSGQVVTVSHDNIIIITSIIVTHHHGKEEICTIAPLLFIQHIVNDKTHHHGKEEICTPHNQHQASLTSCFFSLSRILPVLLKI